MSYFGEADRSVDLPPFAVFRDHFGFIPNLFLAQTRLPELIQAEAALLSVLLFGKHRLSRIQRECILFVLAAASGNVYCCTLHHQMLLQLGVSEERLTRILADFRQADLSPQNLALLRFTHMLGTNGCRVSQADVAEARTAGWDDESLLEAVQIAALSRLLCTLSAGMGAAPDFAPVAIPPQEVMGSSAIVEPSVPYLHLETKAPPSFAFLKEAWGFVPGVFTAQAASPDVLDAEAGLLRTILLSEFLLTRQQKARILIASSSANRNGYWVAASAEVLRGFGIDQDRARQIALGGPAEENPESLRRHGFTDDQIPEAVAVIALTGFLNTIQFGLGTPSDFALSPGFLRTEKIPHLSAPEPRHTDVVVPPDPDAEWVARVRSGNVDAFEELMNRHNKRVYRTLLGILGNPEDARDAMQDTFLKAFQNLQRFEGRSKFSTWLISIASNTGLQKLRERRNVESLDDGTFESEEGFRPRQVQAWGENPEQLYSQTERRSLIEDGVMKLPAKYRVVLMLRDVEQIPVEDAAAALDLGIPAFKARLLRGRLMLREALAPHFTAGAKGVMA